MEGQVGGEWGQVGRQVEDRGTGGEGTEGWGGQGDRWVGGQGAGRDS